MYEHKTHRPLDRSAFLRRVAGHLVLVLGLGILSLAIGVLGYHGFEHLSYLDAFLNASMLLGGMGPVDMPRTDGGKLFASLYALYSGVVFLFGSTILLAPFVHRLLHKLHWSEQL